MINNLSIVIHTFARCMLTSLSVDKILLPRYVNLSTNFRGGPLRLEMVPSHLKPMHFVLHLGLVGRVFANGLGDLGLIPGRVIPKTLKMVLDTSLLNTQQYKVCIKGKVEQSREPSGRPRLRSPTLLLTYFVSCIQVKTDAFYYLH